MSWAKTVVRLTKLNGIFAVSVNKPIPATTNLKTADIPKPNNTTRPDLPPRSPETNTCAVAVPSGYNSVPGVPGVPCILTIKARRSGIIARMPRMPPNTEMTTTRVRFMSKPSSRNAGMVTPTPKAIDSPAEPAVCTMLFSRIVVRRTPSTPNARNSVAANTATGIEAEVVRPILRTR